jgi:hypothetical protein
MLTACVLPYAKTGGLADRLIEKGMAPVSRSPERRRTPGGRFLSTQHHRRPSQINSFENGKLFFKALHYEKKNYYYFINLFLSTPPPPSPPVEAPVAVQPAPVAVQPAPVAVQPAVAVHHLTISF